MAQSTSSRLHSTCANSTVIPKELPPLAMSRPSVMARALMKNRSLSNATTSSSRRWTYPVYVDTRTAQEKSRATIIYSWMKRKPIEQNRPSSDPVPVYTLLRPSRCQHQKPRNGNPDVTGLLAKVMKRRRSIMDDPLDGNSSKALIQSFKTMNLDGLIGGQLSPLVPAIIKIICPLEADACAARQRQ